MMTSKCSCIPFSINCSLAVIREPIFESRDISPERVAHHVFISVIVIRTMTVRARGHAFVNAKARARMRVSFHNVRIFFGELGENEIICYLSLSFRSTHFPEINFFRWKERARKPAILTKERE